MSFPPGPGRLPVRWRRVRLVASVILALALAAASVILLGPAAMAASPSTAYQPGWTVSVSCAPADCSTAGSGSTVTVTATGSVQASHDVLVTYMANDPTLMPNWPSPSILDLDGYNASAPGPSYLPDTGGGHFTTDPRTGVTAPWRYIVITTDAGGVSARGPALAVWDQQAAPVAAPTTTAAPTSAPATTTPPASSSPSTSSAPASSTSAAAPTSTDASTPSSPPTNPPGTTTVVLSADDTTTVSILAGLALLVFFSAATFVGSLGKG